MTYFSNLRKILPIIQTDNKKVILWQRKKPYLSVNHVDFNHLDGWGNVPLVMSGRA